MAGEKAHLRFVATQSLTLLLACNAEEKHTGSFPAHDKRRRVSVISYAPSQRHCAYQWVLNEQAAVRN